jgi:RNA polymerase primary sigma factor
MGLTPYVGSAVAYHGLDGTFEVTLRSWLRKIGEVPLLTPEAEKELARLKLEGSAEAGNELAERNLRLVVRIAKQFAGKGVPISDLIQEGNIGLLHAVSKFDYRLGFRFSTYAVWWVRQSVHRAVCCQSRTIRIPSEVHSLVAKSREIASRISHIDGREPSQIEITNELKIPLSKWLALCSVLPYTFSLDAPVDGKEGAVLSDILEDDVSTGPFESAHRENVSSTVKDLLRCLSPRERQVIELRYGLLDGDTRSLESIAESMGVTRERVRQVQERALAKLRVAASAAELIEIT